MESPILNVLRDPEFRKLPRHVQLYGLGQLDPKFAQLPRGAQEAALQDPRFRPDGSIPETYRPPQTPAQPQRREATIGAAPERPIWDRVQDVFSQGAIGQLFGPRTNPDLAALDKNAVPGVQKPVLKLSRLSRQGNPKTITEGAQMGFFEGLEGWTSTEGLSMMALLGGLGRLRGVGQAAAAAMGAGFDADMIKTAIDSVPEAKELWESGQQPEAARVAVRHLLGAGLGAAGAVKKGKALSKQTPITDRPLTRTERQTVQDRAAQMNTNKLQREAKKMNPPAAEAMLEVVAERQAGKGVPEPKSAGEAQPRMTRAERRATVEPPKTETPDNPELAAESLKEPELLVDPRLKKIAADLDLGEYEKLSAAEKATVRKLRDERATSREVEKQEQAQPQETPEQQAGEKAVQPDVSRETPQRTPKTTPVYGRETEIRIPGEKKRYRAVYALREADDVQASHNAFNFEKNPAYEFQNDRNYAEPQNAERIVKQTAEFDSAFLVNDNPTAEQGPPIIDARGNVLGGNSRTMTLARVEKENPEALARYRETVAKEAKKFGLDPVLAGRMKRPVLVRELAEEVKEPQLAITDFNKVGTAELRLAERAIADSRRVSAGTLDELTRRIEDQGPEGTLAKALEGDGRAMIERLVEDGVITTQEKPKVLNSDGTLTTEGKSRVTRLLTGRLFEDARSFEDTAPELRGKLERVVAPLAKVEGKEGWDLAESTRAAVNLLEESRRRGVKLDDLVEQRGLFGESGYSEQTVAIARKLQEKPTEVARAFRQYANEAEMGAGGQGLLGMEPPTAAESFRAAFVEKAEASVSALDRAEAKIKGRIAKRWKEAGSTLSAGPGLAVEQLADYAALGAVKIAQGARKFSAWSAEMLKEHGDRIRPHLEAIWRRSVEVYEQEVKAGRLEVTPKPGKGQAEGSRRMAASPSLEETQAKFVEKVSGTLGEDAGKVIAKATAEWIEREKPELRKVGFEEIRKQASEMDPLLLLEMDVEKAKQLALLEPGVYHGLRNGLHSLMVEIAERQERMREPLGNQDPVVRLQAEQDLLKLERDAQKLTDIILPVRSQRGRLLAYERMFAEQTFDRGYWEERAKKALALPEGVKLPDRVNQGVGERIDAGVEAEEKAARRVLTPRARREAAKEIGEPTPEEKKERYKKRLEELVAKKLAGQEKARGKSKWALTAEELAEVNRDPAVRAARRELARYVAEQHKQGWADLLLGIRRAGLLTGTGTHIRNNTSNAAYQAITEVSRPGAMVADWAIRHFHPGAVKERTVQGMSWDAIRKASRESATQGFEEARQILKTGQVPDEGSALIDFSREFTAGRDKLGERLGAKVDAYVNLVFRTMKAEDRFAKRYAFRRSLEEQMKLAKVATPTPDMMTQAWLDADFQTFNNPNAAARAISITEGWLRNQGVGGKALAAAIDLILPFKNTPANVWARGFENAGAGVFTGAVKLFAQGKKPMTAAQQRAIAMEIGRGATGMGVLMAGYLLARSGMLTGITDRDETGERNVKEAGGRMEASLRVGGKWVSVLGLSPVSNALILGATWYESGRGDLLKILLEPETAGAMQAAAFRDLPVMRGVSDALEAAQNPARSGRRFAAGMAGSFVPSIVNEAGQLTDTARRDTAAETFGGAIARGVAGRVPGARQLLPERLDLFGQPVPQDKIGTALGFPASTETKDPVLLEMMRVEASVGKARKGKEESEEQLAARQARGSKGTERKPAETEAFYRARVKAQGDAMRNRLKLLMATSGYQRADDDVKREMIEQTITKARARVNREAKKGNLPAR